MINKVWLKKCLKSNNGRGFVIIITVKNSTKVFQLYSKRLKFKKALKVVKKYWKTRFSSISMNCVGIEHDQLKKFDNKKVQYIIYADAYKIESHKCDMIK